MSRLKKERLVSFLVPQMNIFSYKLSSNAYEIKLFMFSTVVKHVKIKMDKKTSQKQLMYEGHFSHENQEQKNRQKWVSFMFCHCTTISVVII